MEESIFRIPEGFNDLMNNDCRLRIGVEEKIRKNFESFGYMEADTPTLEYYDLFDGKVEVLPQQRMFKLFDSEGSILVIRPDMTVPIMRMALSKMGDLDYPKKICYFGNVFRNDIKNNISCEYRQAGIEIIGSSHKTADAEVIAVAVKSLIDAGIDQFRIDIGQVKLFKALSIGIEDNELMGEIRQAVQDKNRSELEILLKGSNIDDNKKQKLLMLPWMFGGLEKLDEAAQIYDGTQEKEAVNEIKSIVDILCSWGYGRYISVDLGMVQNLNYYSSIIFRGYTRDCGFSICWGGRYDCLSNNFGKNIPATGCALGINRIVEIINRKGKCDGMKGADYMVTTWNGMLYDTAYKVSEKLRSSGYIVESDLIYDEKRIISYCRSKKILNLIKILDRDIVQVTDLETGRETKYSLDFILGKDERCVI